MSARVKADLTIEFAAYPDPEARAWLTWQIERLFEDDALGPVKVSWLVDRLDAQGIATYDDGGDET